MNDSRKDVIIKHPVRSRFCITKTAKLWFFMAPINDEDSSALDKAINRNVTIDIGDHVVNRFNTKEILDDPTNTSEIPYGIQANLQELFGADKIVIKPAQLNYETMMGSNYKWNECNGFLDHYLFGLATIGNPDRVIIYSVPNVKFSK